MHHDIDPLEYVLPTEALSPASDDLEPRKRAEATHPGEQSPADTGHSGERVSPYVPRILQQHLAEESSRPCWLSDGSSALVDISGFTQLSERLSRKGKEG